MKEYLRLFSTFQMTSKGLGRLTLLFIKVPICKQQQ